MPSVIPLKLRAPGAPGLLRFMIRVEREGIAASPPNAIEIVNHNNTRVVHVGSGAYTIEKISGAVDTRDAGAVSSVGIDGDFVLRLKHVSTIDNLAWNAGMNSDPLTDDDYASIDFSWFYTPSSALWTVGESGAFPTGNFADATYAWIWRSGTSLNYGRGGDLATAKANPDRTVTSSATLYFDSSIPSIGGQIEAQLYTTTGYALTADFGSFSYTGQAANLPIGGILTAAQGTFTYTGQAASATAAYLLPAAQATFSYTGQSTVLATALVASFGSFTYTGQSANLLRGFSMAAAQATFSYTGQAANLLHGYALAAAQGAYIYSGQSAALAVGLAATVGSYSYAGQVAQLERGYELATSTATFSYAGQPAFFMQGLGLFAAAGTFAYTGQSNLLIAPGLSLPVAVGVYAYTGQDAVLAYFREWFRRSVPPASATATDEAGPSEASLALTATPPTVGIIRAAPPPSVDLEGE
jgi:hypothetical protein